MALSSLSSALRTAFAWLAAVCVIAAAFMATEVVVFALSDGRWPNEVRSPMAEFWGLFQILWEQNPGEAAKHLLQQSAWEFAHVDPETELNLWRIYYYVPGLSAHVIAAAVLVLAWHWVKSADVTGWIVVALSILLLIGSSTYVSHAIHCTGPTWLFDTLLRAYQSPFNEMSPFWEDKPITAGGAFLVMQWTFSVVGVGMAWRTLANRRDRATF